MRLRLSGLGVLVLLALGGLAAPAWAQSSSGDVVTVQIVDAGGQPVAGAGVMLVLYRFGETLEAVPSGACQTDAAGQCRMSVTDPPRRASGWIEGEVIARAYGQQKFGWAGGPVTVTLQLTADGILPTVPAPLGGPYDDATPPPETTPAGQTPSVMVVSSLPPATPTTPASVAAPASAWDRLAWGLGLTALVGGFVAVAYLWQEGQRRQ